MIYRDFNFVVTATLWPTTDLMNVQESLVKQKNAINTVDSDVPLFGRLSCGPGRIL